MELTTTLSNSTSLATLAVQTEREVLDTMTVEQLIDQSAVASRFGEMTLNKLRTWYRLLFARLEYEDDIGKKYQFLEMGAVIFQDYLLTGDLFAAEYLEKSELEKKASSVKHARQSFNNWRYVETKWGVVAKGALEQVGNGIGTIADAAAMARAIEWPDSCACINRAVIDRLQTTKRGRSAAKNVIAGDIKKAAATLKTGSSQINHPSSEEIRGLGLDLQDSGLLGPRRARAIQPNFFDDAEMDNATQQLRIGPGPGTTKKDEGYRGEPRTRKRRKVVSQDKHDPVLVYQYSDTSLSTRESPECRCTNQAGQFASTIGCPSSTGSENVWALVVSVKDLVKDLCDIHVLKLAEYVELASDHISNIRTKLICLASETSLATAKRRNRTWFTEFSNELDWLRIYPHLNYRPDITSHTQIRVSSERLFELIRPFVAFDENYGRMLNEDGAVVIKNYLGRFQDQGQKWEKAYQSFGDEFSMFQHHGQGSELKNPLVEAMKHSIVQQFF
ncbi:hypothetical protein PMAA_102270 [Talaromyces marneffei ATCC 18224]|uniref:Uncharacterized protein n=1 Tax=Talaromyces marneffei (strain ATCC 18224 / CBS 334.59 / QM 7333) TaxID=441960 RepID=B6QH25_TALMQ|nr:hypothetical protein PMAA_102270 [Talaromyces marneffei ATCC 18224]